MKFFFFSSLVLGSQSTVLQCSDRPENCDSKFPPKKQTTDFVPCFPSLDQRALLTLLIPEEGKKKKKSLVSSRLQADDVSCG